MSHFPATWLPHTRDPGSPMLAPELFARVRSIHIRTHRLVDAALAGGYRSTFRGQGIEFEEVRPYQPGDDVRSIDWNVTARTGEPYIKTYTEERELTIQLVVDTGMPMDFGSRRWTKREAAAQLGALIAYVAMYHQDRVGLVLFGAQPGLHLPCAKGTKHILRLIREMIAAPTTWSGSDLCAVIETQQRVLHRRSLVFRISDFLSEADRGHCGMLHLSNATVYDLESNKILFRKRTLAVNRSLVIFAAPLLSHESLPKGVFEPPLVGLSHN